MKKLTDIKSFKIHPSIGIARLGNSPDGFFIGPEIPGQNNPPEGGYKDSKMRVKRQAARFRIFGYDANDKVVMEITSANAEIKWTAHLANKKAAWKEFDGLNANAPLRNRSEKNRSRLIIDPGERSLHAINTAAVFDSGKFFDDAIPLGEMRMDQDGRLLILGGFGHSASPQNKPLVEFGNNDGWHDDISDGPVKAEVKLKGSSHSLHGLPAWVICAPPDFAPPLTNVITLYDTLIQVAIDRVGLVLPEIPSFKDDIFPILGRANNLKWVSMMMWKMHNAHGGRPKTMESKHKDMEEAMPLITNDALRNKVFMKLTDPRDPLGGDDNDMPMLWSDYYQDQKKKNGMPRNETLTKWQFDYLKKWAEGNFKKDWGGMPVAITEITPKGLDMAALENCIGGPFFPGIEASWLLRDHYDFSEPLRLSHGLLEAGDVTKQMALPWQADFFDCSQDGELAWWPAQRPDEVFIDDSHDMHKWTRWHVTDFQSMVKKRHQLGFVVKKGAKYLETERNP
jgi:L-Lysine epsilon oxidase N-terminal/L-lysine epsilon oxidase C-terminal domain